MGKGAGGSVIALLAFALLVGLVAKSLCILSIFAAIFVAARMVR